MGSKEDGIIFLIYEELKFQIMHEWVTSGQTEDHRTWSFLL